MKGSGIPPLLVLGGHCLSYGGDFHAIRYGGNGKKKGHQTVHGQTQEVTQGDRQGFPQSENRLQKKQSQLHGWAQKSLEGE